MQRVTTSVDLVGSLLRNASSGASITFRDSRTNPHKFSKPQKFSKRHRVEKTEFVRRLNYGNQLYGAIGANLSPAPPAKRRPDSNNTNKSELLNEQLSEDDQSVRTMIVSLFFI